MRWFGLAERCRRDAFAVGLRRPGGAEEAPQLPGASAHGRRKRLMARSAALERTPGEREESRSGYRRRMRKRSRGQGQLGPRRAGRRASHGSARVDESGAEGLRRAPRSRASTTVPAATRARRTRRSRAVGAALAAARPRPASQEHSAAHPRERGPKRRRQVRLARSWPPERLLESCQPFGGRAGDSVGSCPSRLVGNVLSRRVSQARSTARRSRDAIRTVHCVLDMLRGNAESIDLEPIDWEGERRRVRAGTCGDTTSSTTRSSAATPARGTRLLRPGRRKACWSAFLAGK